MIEQFLAYGIWVAIVFIIVGLLDWAGSFLHETMNEAAITAAMSMDAVLKAFRIMCLRKVSYLLLLHTFPRIQKSDQSKRMPFMQMRCFLLS